MLKMLFKYILITISLLSIVVADTINVPSDFPTIQGTFNAADLNSDGLLNILDVVALVSIILGN